jgi:hypothetical protein
LSAQPKVEALAGTNRASGFLRLLLMATPAGNILNDNIARQKPVREFIRWMILRMLYACRPGAANETIILRVLQNLDFDCELDDVRQAFDYMRSVGLAESHSGRTGWRARLTTLGVAVAEYGTGAPAGIGRPRRWRNSNRRCATPGL